MDDSFLDFKALTFIKLEGFPTRTCDALTYNKLARASDLKCVPGNLVSTSPTSSQATFNKSEALAQSCIHTHTRALHNEGSFVLPLKYATC